MRPEQLNPNVLEAQALKIAILRLLNSFETPCELQAEDSQFDEYGLVLVLGRRRTPESRRALIELLDFILPDAISDAIVAVIEEDRAAYLPLLKSRIGQPLCAEALRKKPYVDAMPQKNRDRQIQFWLSDSDA
jgi:hypothetical protein